MTTTLTIQHADKNNEVLKLQTSGGEFVITPGGAMTFTIECDDENDAILIEACTIGALADAASQELLQEPLDIDAALSDELLDKADAVSMETDELNITKNEIHEMNFSKNDLTDEEVDDILNKTE